MNCDLKKVSLAVLFFILAAAGYGETDKKLEPVTFEKVKMEDNFWLPRLKRQKDILVPFALKNTEPGSTSRLGDVTHCSTCRAMWHLTFSR